MKKLVKAVGVMLASLCCTFVVSVNVQAEENKTIHKGVYADTVDLSGLTREEALGAINFYVEELKDTRISLLIGDEESVDVTARQLGLKWKNEELVDEALSLGTTGNIIDRYKTLKDLEYENKVLTVKLGFGISDVNGVLLEQCVPMNRPAKDASLTRQNGEFSVIPGQSGFQIDVEASIDNIIHSLDEEWNPSGMQIPLEVTVTQPKGKTEDLMKVTDLLGTFTTSYSTSGSSRSANVENGCRLINGTTLYPGEEFSAYETVSPFSTANGYYMAGSYVNGKVVDSLGGGICQVSTTLYNAVLLSELEVSERHNHSMIVTYVDPSADAAIAESAGKDFKFVNNTDYPIYIEGIAEGKKITFNIYGSEYRSPEHEVKYVSEVLETIRPQSDVIYPDAGQPIGYITVASAHIGYKARLWKVVYENGVEISRDQVNSSNYKMSPRQATVGVASADPAATEEMMAAIGTNSIDHVKNVIALLQSQANPENPQ